MTMGDQAVSDEREAEWQPFLRGRQFIVHIVGQRGIRDTQHPCDLFAPVPYGTGDGRCHGDGHYLCKECDEHNQSLVPFLTD